MARIAKGDVHDALMRAAQQIVDAGGSDGRVSRADIKAKVKSLEGTERSLVDIFFRFIDHRDFKKGATVTGKDVDKAVEYAKQKLVDNYDLNNNGLSKDEVARMSTTGQLAVRLARELKAASASVAQNNAGVDNDPSWIELGDMNNADAVALLADKFPGINFDDMMGEAKEVVYNREGTLNDPLCFGYLERRADGSHLVSIQGEFEYEGAEFSFYADFRITGSDYTLSDAGAD